MHSYSGLLPWLPSRNTGAIDGQKPREAAGGSSQEACWRGQSVLSAQCRATESCCTRRKAPGRLWDLEAPLQSLTEPAPGLGPWAGPEGAPVCDMTVDLMPLISSAPAGVAGCPLSSACCLCPLLTSKSLVVHCMHNCLVGCFSQPRTPPLLALWGLDLALCLASSSSCSIWPPAHPIAKLSPFFTPRGPQHRTVCRADCSIVHSGDTRHLCSKCPRPFLITKDVLMALPLSGSSCHQIYRSGAQPPRPFPLGCPCHVHSSPNGTTSAFLLCFLRQKHFKLL